MPYYIYRIKPFGQLDKLTDCASFTQATQQAKALRTQQAPGTTEKIKVIFADDELQAEELLSQVRSPAPQGDD